MTNIPTVARIVHYKSRGSADGKFPSVPRAAIISDVRESTIGSYIERTRNFHDAPTPETPKAYEVKLTVFNPEGLFFTDWLQQGDAPGNWNWPPIV